MTRSSIIFGLLLLVGAASSTAADDKQPDSPKERSQRLQSYLDDEEYRFRPMLASVDWSFGQYTGATRLQMIYDSKRYGVTFRFGKDGDLLELHGHDGTVFKEKDNVLYFAEFGHGHCGCTVDAYDLNTGKRLWKTPLQAVGFVPHSAYLNEVTLDLRTINPGNDDQAVCITGHEGYGDYMEILDMKTGEILAHRVYRKGY